jgi:DNA-binding response OmpR family regulator
VATILIVEDDGLVARQMARTLRDASHTPTLAPSGRSALQEADDRPDLVLLDLGLPDLPGEEVLKRLKSRPDTAQTPILVITGKREAARRLRESDKAWVADILLKPVSGAQLRQAVDAALASHHEPDADALRLAQERQSQLIQRLILQGSDLLVFHTCRRISVDRSKERGSAPADALTWTEISDWARREGLVDAEQASLLRRIPATRQQAVREGAAKPPAAAMAPGP